MSRSARKNSTRSTLREAQIDYLFRRAALAAVLFDPMGAEALLKLPDAEVGRRFKICLARVMGLATVLNLDLRALGEKGETRRSRRKRGAIRRMASRDALVADGKLLRAGLLYEALGITEQRLSKRVAKGRMFGVEIGGEQYYPAFFLARGLDRKDLAKVAQQLGGLDGWSKWSFFTRPKESLGGLTPLQALLRGDVKQVLRTAKRFRKLENGKGPRQRRRSREDN
ncbi:hypothetical protein QCE49_24180 [Caballeronia sp. LZ008]|uniref:hypothetical protein n=1 Tax=unclassified Caballeronia TaxID=2646786 RepID=UPI0020299265|nr:MULTISPECIES: hypothetical protein [unclassified Caballeronia]MDR5796487.1 hypothetical protein [Caballeronia sp. LZ008]